MGLRPGGGSRTRSCGGRRKWIRDGAWALGEPRRQPVWQSARLAALRRRPRCGGRSSGGDGGRGASGSGDRSHAGRSSDGGCGGLGPCDGSCDGLSRHRRVIGANTPGSRRFSAAQALVMPRAFRPNLYRTIKVCIRTEKRAARRIFFLIAPVPLLASSHYAGGAFRRLHISGAVGRSDGEQDAAARARSAQPPRLFGACAAAPPGCFSFIMLHSLALHVLFHPHLFISLT